VPLVAYIGVAAYSFFGATRGLAKTAPLSGVDAGL